MRVATIIIKVTTTGLKGAFGSATWVIIWGLLAKLYVPWCMIALLAVSNSEKLPNLGS